MEADLTRSVGCLVPGALGAEAAFQPWMDL
jgi:hypothetical protein